MLVLARKEGQRVMIGHDIVVTVVAIRGTSVRLGIEAPADVDIWREEILRKHDDAGPAHERSRGRALAGRLAAGQSVG